MLDVLAHPVFRRLFAAQLIALLGTGLMTVALGLLAYDLAGDRAAAVLGTVFTIKMVAYVGLSPLMAAMAERLARKGFLVVLDLVRVGVAACLPFADEIWQVYALIFVLQTASAGFTPAFQAVIPDILTDEADYTRALSLSRLAYDLENLASPALAALLLLLLSFSSLFALTAVGFLLSALLVAMSAVPPRCDSRPAPFRERVARGIRLYLATPRLRGLLALNLAAAAGGAMVLVNTVVLVRSTLGFGEVPVAIAMGAFGAGSMIAALALPRALDRVGDRRVMFAGTGALCGSLLALALVTRFFGFGWGPLLAAWVFAGVGYGAILTPSGRLLRRSSGPSERPALFAAQFALSHACWLVAYPLAGALMTRGGPVPALVSLAGLALVACAVAYRVWPAGSEAPVEHHHPDLPPDHPHLRGGHPHAHPERFDELHIGRG